MRAPVRRVPGLPRRMRRPHQVPVCWTRNRRVGRRQARDQARHDRTARRHVEVGGRLSGGPAPTSQVEGSKIEANKSKEPGRDRRTAAPRCAARWVRSLPASRPDGGGGGRGWNGALAAGRVPTIRRGRAAPGSRRECRCHPRWGGRVGPSPADAGPPPSAQGEQEPPVRNGPTYLFGRGRGCQAWTLSEAAVAGLLRGTRPRTPRTRATAAVRGSAGGAHPRRSACRAAGLAARGSHARWTGRVYRPDRSA
ncbi:hypothetical protein MPEAHAMD_6023 [Methylobacterium frigidaeris]|uniref:Uncharacterized protein n=1 Tax=Methylobacterium frigidaeris TaxID=2038277 RepID=A0AA37M853_9HYPH|nr:hypothetical protein MPEAHAMD_6023 [Methylobacterium frigidaeris]